MRCYGMGWGMGREGDEFPGETAAAYKLGGRKGGSFFLGAGGREAPRSTLHNSSPLFLIIWPLLLSPHRVFDRNGDGYISKAEFKHCMMHFGEQFTDDEVEEMISDADSNNDGKIDYTEFSEMILKEIRMEAERNEQRRQKEAAAGAQQIMQRLMKNK